MASRGRGARAKGHNFERKIANYLTEKTGLKFKRGLNQSRSGGAEGSDVMSEELPELHFELKRMVRCNIKSALKQAQDDIDKQNVDRIPVIITKNDREDTLVTMVLDDWVTFLQSYISTNE